MAIPVETIDERPVSAVFTTGRVFYLVRNVVYYSQILEGNNTSTVAKCYSKNDPTAEQLSDILATDGGTITINEGAQGVEIAEISNGVVVFCTNGVWSITGGDNPFSATNFLIRKISNYGAVNKQSIVNVGPAYYYWSETKIHALAPNEFNQLKDVDLTGETIGEFYKQIPLESKRNAFGFYNRKSDSIEWYYRSTEATATDDIKASKDRGLFFNLKTQGFFPQQFRSELEAPVSGEGEFLACGVDISSVVDSNPWYILGGRVVAGTPTIQLKLGKQDDESFNDFNVAYPVAYFETGYETLGKPSNKKEAPYIVTHFVQTEENWVADGLGGLELDKQSSCNLRAKWDWNGTSTNGRWAPSQEAYRFRRPNIPAAAGAFDSGETVITTKNKMLGRGQSITVRFEQTPNKDMRVLGYTIQWSMNNRV